METRRGRRSRLLAAP